MHSSVPQLYRCTNGDPREPLGFVATSEAMNLVRFRSLHVVPLSTPLGANEVRLFHMRANNLFRPEALRLYAPGGARVLSVLARETRVAAIDQGHDDWTLAQAVTIEPGEELLAEVRAQNAGRVDALAMGLATESTADGASICLAPMQGVSEARKERFEVPGAVDGNPFYLVIEMRAPRILSVRAIRFRSDAPEHLAIRDLKVGRDSQFLASTTASGMSLALLTQRTPWTLETAERGITITLTVANYDARPHWYELDLYVDDEPKAA
jgi:hypothetical protein